MENLRVLTVISHGEFGNTYRFTANAMNVDCVQASEKLVVRNGMNLYEVKVFFSEESSATLYVSGDDLRKLEEAVGSYGFD